MSRIFWDTSLFVYLFEEDGERADRVASLRRRLLARGDDLVTSTITIGEILVKPARAGRVDLGRQYEQRISQAATIAPFDLAAARSYAEIRAAARRRDRTRFSWPVPPPASISSSRMTNG